MPQHGWTLKACAVWSCYTRYLEWANSFQQKIKQLPGAGGRRDGELFFKGYRASVWNDEKFWSGC